MLSQTPPIPALPAPQRLIVAVVAALLCCIFFAQDARAATISGTVTDTHGQPLEGVSVTAYVEDINQSPSTWYPVGFTYSGINGEYLINNLLTGTYRLQISPYNNYFEEFYDNQSTLESATDIVLANENVDLTGINISLTSYGRIVGKVMDPDDQPIPDVSVSLWYETEFGPNVESFAYTDNGGDFSFWVGNPNPYKLQFAPTGSAFIPEYYNHKNSFESADAISVQPDEIITVTVNLSRTKTISGTVTDSHSQPVDFVANLYRMDENDQWEQIYIAPGAYDIGKYRFEGLDPGKYRVEFTGSAIIPEFYQDKVLFEQAEILNLTGAPDTLVANAVVARRGIITGTVSDHNGAPIEAIDAVLYYQEGSDWLIQDSALTDSNGNYTLRQALPTRSYRIAFDGKNYHSEFPYVSEYFDNVATIEAAQAITVPAESTIPNINAQLDSYGVITGIVTGSDDLPLAGVMVQAYDRATTFAAGYTFTDAAGHYQLALAPNTEFSIGFAHSTHEAEFYDDQPNLAAGTPVTVAVNSLLPNINAQLLPGPVISGTVTDNNGAPVVGIDVVAYDAYFAAQATVLTDEQGHYAVSLASGTYRLGFNVGDWDHVNPDYIGEYYADAESIGDAAPVALALGHDVTIDVELAVVPSIQGHVTNHAGEPAGFDVQANLLQRVEVDGLPEWQCCPYSTSPDSFTDGQYALRGLAPGEYILQFDASFSSYLSEYYPDQYSLEGATVFTVTDRTVFRNVDAVLDRPGIVQGTVVNEANQPLSNIEVLVYDEHAFTGDDFYSPYSAYTDESGNFTFLVLPFARWLEFRDTTYQYAGEFYNNQPSVLTSQAITVGAETTKTVQVTLGASATITGHVTDWRGDSLSGVWVWVYRPWPGLSVPWQFINSVGAYTDEHGNYSLSGLTPNEHYRVSFVYDYVVFFYPHGDTVADAQDVVSPAATVLPNINMIMLQPGEVYADFSATPRSGTGTVTVDFTNQSLGDVKGRLWQFGDGSTSTQLNPSHTYTATGVYTVTLIVSGTVNTDRETKASYITLTDTAITGLGIQRSGAGGSGAGGSGDTPPVAGQTLYFSATAAGSNVQYVWDFGDGAAGADVAVVAALATGQFVQHAYAAAGTYTVTLTARNGMDEQVLTQQIIIGPRPVSALALYGPSTGRIGQAIAFSATVGAGDDVSYVWDFGDGETANGARVEHSYAATGDYTVSVTAANSTNAQSATQPITIRPASDDAAITRLTLHGPDTVSVNAAVTFSATVASGDNVSYTWDFGDGTSGSGEVVSHAYATPGTYTITLTAGNGAGEISVTGQIVVKYGLVMPQIWR